MSDEPRLSLDDQDILYHRGRVHLLVSTNSHARMFKVDQNSWRVHRVLAQANAEAGAWTRSPNMRPPSSLPPTSPSLHEELGTEYRSVNKIPEAEAAFRQELQIDPHNLLPTYNLDANRSREG